jgi:hypothetical protein
MGAREEMSVVANARGGLIQAVATELDVELGLGFVRDWSGSENLRVRV